MLARSRSTWSGRAASSRQRVERLTAIGIAWPSSSHRRGLGERGPQTRARSAEDEAGALGERDELAGGDVARARGGASAAAPRRRSGARRRGRTSAGSAARAGRRPRARGADPRATVESRGRVDAVLGIEEHGARPCAPWRSTSRCRRWRSSVSGVVPCSGDIATPMLAVDVECRAGGRDSCGAARRAACRDGARRARGRATAGSSTANSSPPRRASVSPRRTHVAPAARATWRSSSSPYAWPSVSLIVLEAVEVDEQRPRPPRRCAPPLQARVRAVLEQEAVRQAGQRVVRRLAAQTARRQQDDAIERRPQQEQAAGDHAVHRARVSRDLRLDRGVGEVDLIHAHGLAARAEAERDVDLQSARALVPVIDAAHEVRDDLASERVLDAFDANGAIADELVPVRPDHPRAGVEDLDPLDARLPQHASSQLAVEHLDPLRRHPIAQIGHREVRLHAGTRYQLGDVLRAAQRSRLDLALQHVSQGHGQHGERHDTQHAEAGEQRPSGHAETHSQRGRREPARVERPGLPRGSHRHGADGRSPYSHTKQRGGSQTHASCVDSTSRQRPGEDDVRHTSQAMTHAHEECAAST